MVQGRVEGEEFGEQSPAAHALIGCRRHAALERPGPEACGRTVQQGLSRNKVGRARVASQSRSVNGWEKVVATASTAMWGWGSGNGEECWGLHGSAGGVRTVRHDYLRRLDSDRLPVTL